MSCRKSIHALPAELLEQIQEYVEGEVIYIPKKKSSKKCWGENTDTRGILAARNAQICQDFQSGMSVKQLSDKYFWWKKASREYCVKEK